MIIAITFLSQRVQLIGMQNAFQELNQILNKAKVQLKPQIFNFFQKCLPYTLNKTISFIQNQTYIITGDIPAMWLRDSFNQIQPYIQFLPKNSAIKQLILGLISLQAKRVIQDPYPNAYLGKPNKTKPYSDVSFRLFLNQKIEVKQDLVHQRKYQIDSIAYFLKLINKAYYTYDHFNITANLIKALRSISQLIQHQLIDKSRGQNMHYTFQRIGFPNQLNHQGKGNPGSLCGLVRSGFRPSDDPVQMPYNIPGNALLAAQLKQIAYGLLSSSISKQIEPIILEIKRKFLKFVASIQYGIKNFGTAVVKGKQIYVYQIDCNGNYVVHEDPNLPSLMSLPYYQFTSIQDPIWLNTKNFLYSNQFKFYFHNYQKTVEGLGSTHTYAQYIWPLGIMSRILSSQNLTEIQKCLNMLLLQNNLMHQSFSVNNANQYTRNDFAWANSMFAQTILILWNGKFKEAVIKLN